MADTNWRQLLRDVNAGWDKQSFVPMPGGQQEPVAGASPATAALAANPQGGGAPAGPDPALVQQLMQDPALLQQLAQDPSMAEQMGLDPTTIEAAMQQAAGQMGDPAMLGMDPSTGGMLGAAPAGPPPEEGGASAEAAPAAPAAAEGAGDIGEVMKAITELKDTVTDLKDEIAEMRANADLVGQVTQLNDRLGQALGDGAN